MRSIDPNALRGLPPTGGGGHVLVEWICNGCGHKALGIPAKLVIPMAGQVQVVNGVTSTNPVILRFCDKCAENVEVQNATVVIPRDGRVVPLSADGDGPPEKKPEPQLVPCPECGGEGWIDHVEEDPKLPKTKCETCAGVGRVEIVAEA